jgi:hypothetical protein
MELRRFTPEGLDVLRTFIDSLSSDVPGDFPNSALTSDSTTESIPVAVHVPDTALFASRHDLAASLFTSFQPLRESVHRALEDDPAVWSWLALAWFRDLCAIDKSGRRKPGELAHWVLTTHGAGSRYFRHLLYGPYKVYGEPGARDARALLCEPVRVVGRMYFQLTSRIELVRCDSVVSTATRLYYDERKNRLRPRSISAETAGGVFRLVSVLRQLECTYDLFSLSADELWHLLPPEFDGFRTASVRGARH